MDPKFADRMSDLSAITDEILEQRWTTLMGIAKAATKHNQARLVLIACGAGLNREGDSWLWEPFREHEKTLPVDDGAELFTRLAECATRYLISDGGHVLPAMLLRLACNTGCQPFSQDLVDASVARLKESSVALPRFSVPAPFWTTEISKPLQEGAADPSIVATQVGALASATQTTLTVVATQVAAVTDWAAEVDRRLSKEQRLIQWLLNGTREDGTPWTSLSTGAIAVDAAAELAKFVVGPPQPRHEASLAQVLLVAGASDSPIAVAATDIATQFEAPKDLALAQLTPIATALANSTALPELKPSKIGLRLLWEITTVDLWDAS